MKRQYYITKPSHLDNLVSDLDEMGHPEFGYHVEVKTGKRTTKQSNSIWLFCTQLAEALNNSGLEIHMEYLGKEIEVPWTKDSVMERLWKPVQEAVMGEVSTRKLDRSQVSKVYEVLARHMSSEHFISIPFPENRR